MAPIPSSILVLLSQRQFAPGATFTEKTIVLIIFAHVCLLYTVLWWILASKVSRDGNNRQRREYGIEMPHYYITAPSNGVHRRSFSSPADLQV
ncbi:hypothetical protein PENSTE_c003G08266 [Penicillium steckii]|uniref:Uncharacterized protein n=1 Tax=Penicillium steckii TaxID=303698 RepID=A0A1V6TTB3_9EURO|nr:hypothetical protein PENSTE_c003G08266 [Penicillium steckii]